MLRVNHNEYQRGFQMEFENGYVLSVQFGPGNYHSNRDTSFVGLKDLVLIDESPNAEIAVFSDHCTHPSGLNILSHPRHWYRPQAIDFGDDDVHGWTTSDEVAAVIAEVVALPRCEIG